MKTRKHTIGVVELLNEHFETKIILYRFFWFVPKGLFLSAKLCGKLAKTSNCFLIVSFFLIMHNL